MIEPEQQKPEQPTPTIVDTHCHLDFSEFDDDRNAVLKQCWSRSVRHIVVPAVTAQTWNRTLTLCTQQAAEPQRPILHPALGMHPMFINEHQPQHLLELDNLVSQSSPVAIGEIGLDFYLKNQDKEKQILFFSKQLIIAKLQDLPVIIHNRKAHDECLQILQETSVNGGIIHAFNGSIQQAEKYIELGFLLGFGGMITFERSSKLRGLLKHIPIESIALETDAPDMTVAQHKGERNSPAYLPYVLKAVANIKGLTTQQVATITTDNAYRVLRLNAQPLSSNR